MVKSTSSESNLWRMTWDEALKATGGQRLFADLQAGLSGVHSFSGIATDTREAMEGKLFVALKGQQFDAHQFLAGAVQQGAAGLLIHCDPEQLPTLIGQELWDQCYQKVVLIQVPDTLRGLQDLAHYWRRCWPMKVIAVSGSNGKTTTKEFLYELLKGEVRVHASQASFNNHWGVPISLLQASPDTQWVIQEMGMNHLGELTRLCEIADPDVALVTMVGQAHIGELGDQNKVAQAKEELYIASPRAVHIFNMDNEWTRAMYGRHQEQQPEVRRLTFSSFSKTADVSLRAESITLAELQLTGVIGGVEGQVRVPVSGRQNVVNLMAASAAALAVGLSPETIWAQLPKCRTGWGRHELIQIKNGVQVLFDAYNANPESMKALLNNLFEWGTEGRKVAVLGEMFELGDDSERLHRELGEAVALVGVDEVWFMGPHHRDFEAGLKQGGFSKKYVLSEAYEQSLAFQMGSVLNPGDVAIIKGSRAMKMERVLADWQSL